jgi:CRP-like cAMP-binding protein
VDELLTALDEDEQEAVRRVAVRRRFARGDIVFHQGDPGDALHVVTTGLLVAQGFSPKGHVVTLNLFPPGAVFGELALLSGDARRTATIVAIDRSETVMLRKRDFDELRARNPRLDELLVSVLASRNRALTFQLLDLLFSTVEARVYRRLLLLDQVASNGEDRWVRMTQDDIAALAATTRATANRALREAARDGLIELGRGRFRVLDRPALERLAPDPARG